MPDTQTAKQRKPKVAWAPERNPKVGAVLAVRGQELDTEIYLSLLADRLQKLINQEPDPQEAVNQAWEMLLGLDLVEGNPPPVKKAGLALIQSGGVEERLSNLGVFPRKMRLLNHSPKAEKLIEETSLLQWVDALSQGLDEHLT